MIQTVGRKHTAVLPIGGSGRSRQKEKRVNGKMTCLPSRDIRVGRVVKGGTMATLTPSRHIRESSAGPASPFGSVADVHAQEDVATVSIV